MSTMVCVEKEEVQSAELLQNGPVARCPGTYLSWQAGARWAGEEAA